LWRQSKVTSIKVFFKFAVWVRVRKLYDILYILLSKILYDVPSSSSTSSLGIMRYCTAVDNRKDEKAWYKFNIYILITLQAEMIVKITFLSFIIIFFISPVLVIYKYLWNQCLFTNTIMSSNPTHGDVYLIQHYMIKFVSDFSWYLFFLHQ
jgi:hypothetical protein